MRRRTLLCLVAGATAWPIAARAQPSAHLPVIGFLGSDSAEGWMERVRAFEKGLAETGFQDGKNVSIEYRWAERHNDRLPALAADLVSRRVDVMVTNGAGVRAAKNATSSIPIVFYTGGNPVAMGFVASLNRPGGNLTGVTGISAELAPKKLQLLYEVIPASKAIAALIDPSLPAADAQVRTLQAAAAELSIQLHIVQASRASDIDAAFATLRKLQAEGLVIGAGSSFTAQTKRIAELSARFGVPAIFQYREFVEAGGLMSYGASLADRTRLVGVYTGRILKGENPANLPIQESTKIELLLNTRTAKALGLTFPASLLARADDVIE